MKLKIFILLVLCSIFSTSFCQEISIIKNFYNDLYNLNCNEEKIVKKYILYRGKTQLTNATNTLKELKNPVDGADSFLGLLKHNISKSDYSIQHYDKFDECEKKMFNRIKKSLKSSIYKIKLNNYPINSYMLVQSNKIISLIGFKKGDIDDFVFLIYY